MQRPKTPPLIAPTTKIVEGRLSCGYEKSIEPSQRGASGDGVLKRTTDQFGGTSGRSKYPMTRPTIIRPTEIRTAAVRLRDAAIKELLFAALIPIN
jgi:hypothetical protein